MFIPDSCGQVQLVAILGIQEQSHKLKAITRTFCPVVFPESTWDEVPEEEMFWKTVQRNIDNITYQHNEHYCNSCKYVFSLVQYIICFIMIKVYLQVIVYACKWDV